MFKLVLDIGCHGIVLESAESPTLDDRFSVLLFDDSGAAVSLHLVRSVWGPDEL